MKQWPLRIRNLVLLGVLLASIVGVASVLTAPRGKQSVSTISPQQREAMKKEGMPLDSVAEHTAATGMSREERERPVDVF